MTSPSHLVEPEHVVRLTGFRPKPDVELTAELAERFLRSWQQSAASAPHPGVLYRELCQQVPQWSAQAAAEIDHPLEFAFLEYMVVSPEMPLAALAPTPTDDFEVFEGLYRVDFRLLNPAAAGTPAALMFNLFELHGPPAMQQGFLMNWVPRGRFKIAEPGMFSSLLHERLLPTARFAPLLPRRRDCVAQALRNDASRATAQRGPRQAQCQLDGKRSSAES